MAKLRMLGVFFFAAKLAGFLCPSFKRTFAQELAGMGSRQDATLMLLKSVIVVSSETRQ